MANIKINQLQGASIPLDGTEIIPGDQGGTTVQITLADVADYVLPYTAENVANKSQNIELDYLSTTKYPSTKAVRDYIDYGVDLQKVTDSGNTTTNEIYSGNIIASTTQVDSSSAYLNKAAGDSGILGVTNPANKKGEIKCTNITADRTYQLPDQSGTLALTSQLPIYKSYAALIDQAGAAAPTAIVLQNTMVGAVTLTNPSGIEGFYRISCPDFIYTKMLVLMIPSGYGTTGTTISATQHTGYIDFAARFAGAGIATFFANLEIRVYP